MSKEEPKEIKIEVEKGQDTSNCLYPLSGGAVMDGYTWTQEIFAVQILFLIPEGTTTKEIKVTIKKRHVYVKVKDKVLMDKDLPEDCDDEESYWDLVDRKELRINLEKTAGMWWKNAFVGEKEVNIEKIPPPQTSMESLNDEAKTSIEKMMYDQKAKALGLPTVEELTREDNVRKLKEKFPNVDFGGLDLSKAKFDFSNSNF